MDVSLSDQYVLLLQNVVNENRLLREQMKHTVDQAKSSLDEINKKVDSLKGSTAGPMRRVRQTGRPIHVPKICRNNVRRKLKSIKAHDGDLSFRFIESVDSQHHSMLVGKVIEELAHEYGGPEKCPWSAVLIKEAFKTYFRSARASHIRTTKGTQQAHITSCRRRNRKDETSQITAILGGFYSAKFVTSSDENGDKEQVSENPPNVEELSTDVEAFGYILKMLLDTCFESAKLPELHDVMASCFIEDRESRPTALELSHQVELADLDYRDWEIRF